jgi:hypothetical protein
MEAVLEGAPIAKEPELRNFDGNARTGQLGERQLQCAAPLAGSSNGNAADSFLEISPRKPKRF